MGGRNECMVSSTGGVIFYSERFLVIDHFGVTKSWKAFFDTLIANFFFDCPKSEMGRATRNIQLWIWEIITDTVFKEKESKKSQHGYNIYFCRGICEL